MCVRAFTDESIMRETRMNDCYFRQITERKKTITKYMSSRDAKDTKNNNITTSLRMELGVLNTHTHK